MISSYICDSFEVVLNKTEPRDLKFLLNTTLDISETSSGSESGGEINEGVDSPLRKRLLGKRKADTNDCEACELTSLDILPLGVFWCKKDKSKFFLGTSTSDEQVYKDSSSSKVTIGPCLFFCSCSS